MKKVALILALMASLGLAGCGGGLKSMRPVAPAQMNETLKPGEAAIVFFRPAMFQGSAANPGIIEAGENEKLSFVAVMPNGTKYFHRTTPGRHSYFWSSFGGLASYILEANLEAGKIYYVFVFGKNSFTPVTDTSDESFRKDLASCRWVENTPEGQIWFNNNHTDLQNKYYMVRVLQADKTPKANAFVMLGGIPVSDGSYGIDLIIKKEYGTKTPVR
jgi:hypothetical protein